MMRGDPDHLSCGPRFLAVAEYSSRTSRVPWSTYRDGYDCQETSGLRSQINKTGDQNLKSHLNA